MKCLNLGANFVKHVVCIAQIVVDTVAAGVNVNINAWNDFEKMCLQIAKNRYIMVTAERECKKSDEFDDAVERARLYKMSLDLGLEPHEFVEMTFNKYKFQYLKRINFYLICCYTFPRCYI